MRHPVRMWLGALGATILVYTMGPAAAQGTAPAAVTDLSAVGGDLSATLSFMAPQGISGGSYDIRYSTVPITAANWDNAEPIASVPAPQATGAKESVKVTGLVPLQHYYFALKGDDASMNAGALSNVADAATTAAGPTLPNVTVGQPGITGYYYQFPDTLGSVAVVPAGGFSVNGQLVPDRNVAFSPAYFVNVQTDPQIAYDNQDFATMVGPTNFGVRWVGQLTVPKDGSWILSVRPGDGMRVWLSDKPIDAINPDPSTQIIEAWGGGTSVVNSAALTLSASKPYYLMAEYFRAGGGGPHLQWTGPGTGDHDDIPTAALTTGSQTTDTSTYGRINGTVADSSGNPVFQNTITLSNGTRAFAAQTDGNGFYSLYLPAGSYTVAGGSPVATVYSHLPTAPVTVTAGAIATIPAITGDLPPFIESTTTSPYDDEFPGPKLDPKWTGVDVFNADHPIDNPGSATANNGVLEITAGGWDINGTGDGAYLTYQTIPGNFAATVQVVTMPANQDWEMGGLDVRLSPDAASAHAFFQTQMNHGMQQKIRAANASDSAEYDLPADTAGKLVFPVYIKIRRVDDKVAFFWTEDPVKGPTHQGYVLPVPGFKGVQQLVVGPLGCAHGDSGTTDPGFQFAHFKVVPLAATTTPGAVKGDLNGDGTVDIKDATLSLQISVGSLTATAAQQAAGDVNGDGKLDLKDTTLILGAAVGVRTL